MVKLNGFVYMFFFSWVFEVSVFQHSFPPEKNDLLRRSEAFEASLGDQTTGGAWGTFVDGILKKRG